MSDRTCVRICIDKKDYEKIKGDRFEADSIEEVSENVISLEASEVNYAEWSELEDILKSKLIPYDKWWDHGGDYDSGNAYYRVINGEYLGCEVNSTNIARIFQIDEILSWESSLEELKAHLTKIKRQLKPFDCKPLYEWSRHKPTAKYKFTELGEEAKRIAIHCRMYRWKDGNLTSIDQEKAKEECETNTHIMYTIGGRVID